MKRAARSTDAPAVPVLQQSGSRLWQDLPAAQGLLGNGEPPALVISERLGEGCRWHPPTLWLGLGCERLTDAPLLEFVLGVMAFAYAGLLGVYFTAVFTRRGSSLSVRLALLAGFVTVLLLQPYVAGVIGLPAALATLAFPWQLVIGTCVAFAIAAAPRGGLSTARQAG